MVVKILFRVAGNDREILKSIEDEDGQLMFPFMADYYLT